MNKEFSESVCYPRSACHFIQTFYGCGISHANPSDMRDDNNPFFLRHFHRALRVVCADMFFGRASNAPIAAHIDIQNETRYLFHVVYFKFNSLT